MEPVASLNRCARVLLLGLAAFLFIFQFSRGSKAHAGTIFDDDWVPPKPLHQSPPNTQPATFIPTRAATDAVTRPSETSVVQSVQRSPIPAKAALARSRALLKAAFMQQLADQSIGGRRRLARSLIDEVPKAAGNAADQYALLAGAIDASKEAQDLRLSFDAAEAMADEFDVDSLSIKVEAALATDLRGDSAAMTTENVKAALELVDPLVAADDFPAATRLLTSARRAATGHSELLATIQSRSQAVGTLRIAHARVIQSLERLKSSPTDAAANASVGAYLCFGKGDWERGLPMLARGSESSAKRLASLELSRPPKAEDVNRIADAWWDLGEKEPEDFRWEIRRHAGSLYESALSGSSGIRRRLNENRIAEAGTATTKPELATLHLAGPHSDCATFTNSLSMKFVRIAPGTFLMGSPTGEPGRQGNETQHRVTLTKPFLLAVTTVTQKQYQTMMGNNPSRSKGDDLPVDEVSWNDAIAFCQKLSEKEGKRYRLPTEAEWEYACRATTTSAFNTGVTIQSDQANYHEDGNGDHDVFRGRATAVASFPPNKWGLYDMHGNVRQWCYDTYGDYPNGSSVDPSGPAQQQNKPHVMRGGSWYYHSDICRSARRDKGDANLRMDTLGFRVALDCQ